MFAKEIRNGITVLKSSLFSEYTKINHLFTTRIGGVSFNKNEMNLGFSSGDEYSNVITNYQRLCSEFGFETQNLVLTKQIHSDIVIDVNKTHRGNGFLYENKFDGTDALITADKDVTLVVFYADCTPVIFYDTKNNVIGACHSGWKGTVKKIGKKTVRKMQELYGSDPSNIIAAIGPCISKCHFETSEDVYTKFKDSFGKDENFLYRKDGNKYYIDLKKANRVQLEEIGISKIDECALCTVCNKDILYSYRADNQKTGRMAVFLQIKGD